MSYLSDELTKQMTKADLSVDDIVAKCTEAGRNISRGQIYKWINSEQTSINADQLDTLANAISPDPLNHALLLAAHLEDERFGQSRLLVTINVLPEDLFSETPKPKTRGEKAIHFLAEQRIISKNVDDLVIDLSRCLGAEI